MACPPVIVAAQQSLNKNMVLSIDMLGIPHICMGMFGAWSIQDCSPSNSWSRLFPLPTYFFLEFFPITPDTPRRTRVFRQIFMDILWFGEQPYRRNFWQLSHGGTHWWFQDGAQLKTLWCYPLVIQHCHGKSTFLIGKPSISMGHFPWLC